MSGFAEDDRKKYVRQLTIPGFGEEQQRLLGNSSAFVTRAGGLGGTVALYLAAAGIGRLVIMHGGNLEWPDLNRQILMAHDKVGQPRAEQISESIHRLNPDVDLTVIAENPHDGNIDEFVAAADVVCDCLPTFEERYLLNRAIVRHRKPMIEGAMNSTEGHLTVIIPGKTACLNCLYPEKPEWWSGDGFPVLGAVSGALGCLVAIEAIKVLTNFGKPLAGKLLTFDTASQEYRKFNLHRSAECSVCGGV